MANAPFAQRGLPFEDAYLDALAGRFGAGVRLVDYAADPKAARRLINGWVADETEERIPELLARGILDEQTALALVNAIYLKAPWHLAFDDRQTRDGRFTLTDGSTVTVPMMATATSIPFAAGAGWRAVELPYVGESLAMMIIVPDELDTFEADLTSGLLSTIGGSLEDKHVQLTLPRFGIETQASLAQVLAALGMPTAFDAAAADFSGMTSAVELYITAVIHQANIDVDEKGTEAAAASAVVLGFVSAGPVVEATLDVDRPFLFALRDRATGAVLFLGRVTDPSIDAEG